MINNAHAEIARYDITPNQQIIFIQQKYALNKAVCNIPMAVTFNQPLNFDLLRQAIKIEIERNDCLRLQFVEDDKKLQQYFKPQLDLPEIKYVDFRGKTTEHQHHYLQKIAAKAIAIQKSTSWQFLFLTSHDGQDGFFFKQHHLANDAGGIFIMINDLMQVYMALLENRELPKPMGSFEQRIQKDLASAANEKLNARDIEFYTEYYKKDGPPIYTAPYGMQTLNNYRRKKKDPALRCCPCFALLNTRSLQTHFDYGQEKTLRLEEFCAANNISIQTLYYLLVRTQSTKANNGELDVTYYLTSGNRATLNDKRTSGMMLNNYTMRTIVPNDISLREALQLIHTTLSDFYHHNVLSGTYVVEIINRLYTFSRLTGYSAGVISYIPFSMQLPEGWNFNVEWISAQILASPFFFGLLHDMRNHELHFYYEYLNSFCNMDDVARIHRNVTKMLDVLLENIDIKLQELLDLLEG